MSACCFSTVDVYLDIENTVIDDLTKGNFIQENCNRINEFIHTIAYPTKVHLYTWGWVRPEDVITETVNRIFAKLNIGDFNKGSVFTKSFSIASAIRRGLIPKEEYNRAIIPGMMKSYYLDKVGCFYADFSHRSDNHVILIDDLVEKTETDSYENVSLVNPTDVPGSLDELLEMLSPKARSSIMTEERSRVQELKFHPINGNYIEAFKSINRIINILRFVVGSTNRTPFSDMRIFEESSLNVKEIPLFERLWGILFGDPATAISIYKTCYIEDGNSKMSFTGATKELLRQLILEDIERNPLEWMEVEDICHLAKYYINRETNKCPI